MKVRIISAIVAIGILIPFVIIGGYPFAFIISIIGMLAYKEVLDLKKSHKEYPFIIKSFGLISMLYIILGEYQVSSLMVLSISKLLLPLIILLLPTIFYEKNNYSTNAALYLLGWIYLLGLLFNFIITIRDVNIYLLLFLLSVSIFTDTFAYIIGILIGKHKMTKLSPKKSWEGAVAGLIGGSIISLIIYANLVDKVSFLVIIITILLSIVGQCGDLFFSKIKRENNIKDYSNIMPGHGGILDRIDSFTFVVFTYVLLIGLL